MVFWEKMRVFFHENLAERVVILHNCTNGRYNYLQGS